VRVTRFLWIAFLGVLFALAIQWLFAFQKRHAEDLPWTPLDLRDPIGLFTANKLAKLDRDPQLCRSLLAEAHIAFNPLPARRQGDNCGWNDAVRLTAPAEIPSPRVPLACPLAAGVDLWLRRVVQPAATELLGSRVTEVEDFGSYACRRTYGRAEGNWSEHARANAIDIAGFRLADGRRITVARDWQKGAGGAFLHRVRDGACSVFATTLSPDYNAAHRDHLHLDQAPRGDFGWRACR
jgi:hypothetical protein